MKKITITVPDAALAMIDSGAKAEGVSRSEFMTAAARRAALRSGRDLLNMHLAADPETKAEFDAARARTLGRVLSARDALARREAA